MGKSLFESDVIEEPVAGQEGNPTGEPTQPTGNEPVQSTPPTGEKIEKPVAEPTKVNWWEEAGRHLNTEFKTPDDFKGVFERAKKADEYEPKVAEFETKTKEYEQRIADMSSLINPLSHFTSRESYVAEQLRKQHPDKSPLVLQEIVTQDNKGMDDLDVLVKQQMLENPDLIGGEQGAKDYILDKYGIDPTTPKTEWSTVLQNKIKIEARGVRKAWDELKSTVKLPEIKTPEQIQADRVAKAEERSKLLTPFREDFSKLDEISEEIEQGEVFKYKLSDEDRKMLPKYFDEYFTVSGLEPTKENLAKVKYLTEAIILRGNIKQTYKVIKGDVETRMKAAEDERLGNSKPSNTRSGLEQGDESEAKKYNDTHGLGGLLRKK